MIPLLIGLGVLIGGALIVANWDAIVDWLHDFVPKLKAAWEKVRDSIPHGARIFGDLVVEGAERLMKISHRLYYKKNEQWIEETTTRKIPESEVPPFIRNKGIKKETDITEEMEEELGLEI
jgi:hypothetical protein